MKTGFVKILSLMLLMALIGPFSAGAHTSEPPEITVLSSEPLITDSSAQTNLNLDAALQGADGRVSLIVELQDPPLGLTALTRNPEYDAESIASQAYLAQVDRQQEIALTEMRKLAPSLQVDFRYRAAFNGFGLRVDPAEAPALLKLETVKHIYPDRMRSLLLDSSVGVINAPALWAELGGQDHAGDGIRIAIIDTGIRSEHPMFSGAGFTQPPGFPRGYCVDNPADLYFQCNDKLIVARFYMPTFAIHGAEVYSPLDIHGHGSHVAGIAAGNPVEVPAGTYSSEAIPISGVAPRAYLMVYKALFTQPDENVSGTDAMLLAALDDALLDGADVVNNSWGGVGIEDPEDSPFTTAIRALNATGAVVVFAAGNSGPGAGTISCPGCLEDALTVGASTADRVFANTLDVTGPGTVPGDLLGLAALTGSGPAIMEDLEAGVLYAGTVDPLNAEACSSFAGEVFSDTIALIPRGGCPFVDKVTHAQAAGARAVAVFNDEPGFPIRMANLGSTLIPAVFISQDQGDALRDWVTSTVSPTVRINAAVTAVYDPAWQDVLWESSSVGPNRNPAVLKPDLVAPGINILSAVSPVFSGGAQYQLWQGTSMAAPHVSGAAALLRQRHPEWTSQQIKTALTSTARREVYQPDGTTQSTPFMMGAGRLNLEQARNAGVTFDQPSFADPDCSLQCGWNGTITNAGFQLTWWEPVVTSPPGMNVQVTPSYVIFGAGESRSFSISVDVSGLAADQWYFADLTWEEKSDALPDAHLPIAVYVTEPIPARLEKNADHVFADPGETVAYTLTLVNEAPVTSAFALTDPIPENASYLSGSATGGLTYDSLEDQLSATVNLPAAQMQLVPDTLHGYIEISTIDPEHPIDPVPCPDSVCDEAALVISGLDFYFNGQPANDVVWSTNGYLQVGSVILGLSSPNQNLPDPDVPNNLLAPLWTDLTGGKWYYALVQVGQGSEAMVYYVFEWKDAALTSALAQKYSFQVWIKRGTDEIWFVYGPQTAALTTGTVGIENRYGNVGFTYYYNGSGTAPVNGTSLKANSSLGMAMFTYALQVGPSKAINIVNLAQAENQSTGEVVQASATVFVGERVYLPLVIR